MSKARHAREAPAQQPKKKARTSKKTQQQQDAQKWGQQVLLGKGGVQIKVNRWAETVP
jgi:hypothetical protein